MHDPTLEQWRSLYQEAEAFRALAPWNWLGDEDLFAVEEPVSGEIGYGIVMGSGGQEFGLELFVGAQGFNGYCQLVGGELIPESMEASMAMRAVAVSFGPREVLGQRDHAVIRSLGLKFRGRNVWPWFRSQRPGYEPWYLEPDEIRLLEIALHQCREVAQRVRARELRLTSGLGGQPVLTRCIREGVWIDEWRVPPAWKDTQDGPWPVDQARVERLNQTATRGRDRWELDLFFAPMAVGERGERPYFPRMLLVVNQQGLSMGSELLRPGDTSKRLHDAMLKVFEQTAHLPREIYIGHAEVVRQLQPLAEALGITIRHADVVLIESVQEYLFDRLL